MKPFTLLISVNHGTKIEVDLSDLNLHNDITSKEDFLTSGRIEMFVESMLQFYYRNYSQAEIHYIDIYAPDDEKPIKEFVVFHKVRQVFGLFEVIRLCGNCLFQKDSICTCLGSNERVNLYNNCNLWKERTK